jgi:hypothetical protein
MNVIQKKVKQNDVLLLSAADKAAAVQKPAAKAAAAQKPAAKAAAVQKPAAKAAAVQKPAAKSAAVEKPAAKTASVQKPAAKAAAKQKPAAKTASVKKPAAKATAVQKPTAKGAAGKAVAGKTRLSKFVAGQNAAMTLEEKMAMYRQGGDPSKAFKLDKEHQKQLSSKFHYALQKSQPAYQEKYQESIASAGKGQKQLAHGNFVRSWVITSTFDQRFLELTQELTQSRQFKQTEHPVSFKELEAKYSILLAVSAGISQPMSL